jgi:hypothetical protein
MLALSVAVLTEQHEGTCAVNCVLRVVYREGHCNLLDFVPAVCSDSYLAAPMLDAVQDVLPVCSDSYLAAPILDAVQDVLPVCSDSYLAADPRLLKFHCILWYIPQIALQINCSLTL